MSDADEVVTLGAIAVVANDTGAPNDVPTPFEAAAQ
jgi:hypothetical protein